MGRLTGTCADDTLNLHSKYSRSRQNVTVLFTIRTLDVALPRGVDPLPRVASRNFPAAVNFVGRSPTSILQKLYST